MGAIIVMNIEVRSKKIKEFLDEISSWSIGIAKFYYDDDVTHMITQADLMGYGEPVEFYMAVKDYVRDIWWQDISAIELTKGRNGEGRWVSCQKESVAYAIEGGHKPSSKTLPAVKIPVKPKKKKKKKNGNIFDGSALDRLFSFK